MRSKIEDYWEIGAKVAIYYAYNRPQEKEEIILDKQKIKRSINISPHIDSPLNRSIIKKITQKEPNNCFIKASEAHKTKRFMRVPQRLPSKTLRIRIANDEDVIDKKAGWIYTEQEELQHVVEWYYQFSKVMRYLVYSFSSSFIYKFIFFHSRPIDCTREWTDQQLYQHFNLTQEEIEEIENSINTIDFSQHV